MTRNSRQNRTLGLRMTAFLAVAMLAAPLHAMALPDPVGPTANPLLDAIGVRDPIGLLPRDEPCARLASKTFTQDHAAPRADFAAYVGSWRDYNVGGVNKAFATTFAGLPQNIRAATLTIVVEPVGDLWTNDGIGLQYNNGGSPSLLWGSSFQSIPPTSTYWNPSSGWTNVGQTKTLTLNLGNLPNAVVPYIGDLRASMSSTGHLDIYVQDDTKVLRATLAITWCECERTGEKVILAGVQDNFDPVANAAQENVNPRAALVSYIAANYYTSQIRNFDQGGVNLWFATTIYGIPSTVYAGWVVIGLHPEGELDYNDGVGLQLNSAGTGFLGGGPVGSTGTKVYTLNTTAMLASLGSGHLDVAVQDDTAVDFIEVHLIYCVCRDVIYEDVTQGSADNFAAPPEATTPDAAMAAYLVSWNGQGAPRQYDDGGQDHLFGTTLMNLPCCILNASLEINLRGDGGLDSNDGIGLQLNGAGTAFLWYASFASLGWGNGVHTLFLPQVVLNDVNFQHSLDVFVQDDTWVDYITLHLQRCRDCPRGIATTLDDAIPAKVQVTPGVVQDPDFVPSVPVLPDGGSGGETNVGVSNGQACGRPTRLITVVTPMGIVYVEDRPGSSSPTGAPGLVEGDGDWIYVESNGQPGLQHGGSSVVPDSPAATDYDTCYDGGEPDTLIY